MTGKPRTGYTPVTALVIPAIAGLLTLGLTGCDESAEEGHTEQKVTVEQVPAAVRTTLEQERKGGTLKELEKVTAEGKTVYAADMVVNGKDQETLIAEDGKVIRRDVEEKGEKDDE